MRFKEGTLLARRAGTETCESFPAVTPNRLVRVRECTGSTFTAFDPYTGLVIKNRHGHPFVFVSDHFEVLAAGTAVAVVGTAVVAARTGESAFASQVGGGHYKDLPDGYQPFQISKALGLNPVEHTILKYLLRHRNKNGVRDLEKIKHCVDILIEQEYKGQ